MAALSPTRTLWTAIWLLAAISLLAACGTDASPPAASPETTAPAEAAESPTPSASPEPTVATTAEPRTQPTTALQPTVATTAEPRTQPTTALQPTVAATAAPTSSTSQPTTAQPPSQPTSQPPTPAPEPTVATTAEPIPQTTPAPSWSGTLTYRVLAAHPHDTSSFTQGLLWSNGLVYESTGLRGQSVLRIVDLPTGRVLQETAAEPRHFGEGLALVEDQLIWLTWQAGTAGVYHRDTLEQTGGFVYTGEGWGLCHDGARLVMSDGSNTLTFRHPETFEALGSVPVTYADGRPVNRLNELECIGGDVWANVWLTDQIVVIDPDTGTVTAEADMAGIFSPHPADTDSNSVLNGIAYRPDTGTFLITGKRWPTVFEVRFEPQS